MSKLENKVAIVSGASRGLGAAIAKRLAADGAKVVVNYVKDEKRAVEVVEAIRAAGGTAIAVQANVSEEAQVQAMFERAMKEFGRVDILVNNAGILELGPLTELDRASFQRLIDVNLWSVIVASREAARCMSDGGRIINVSSSGARTGMAYMVMYSASKGGLEAATRGLAAELAPRKICVNAISPGMAESDMTARFSAEQKQGVAQITPLGRLGTPQDFSGVVAFLASEDAGWITGQVIPVNGGYLM